MSTRRLSLRFGAFVFSTLMLSFAAQTSAISLPSKFTTETIGGGWNEVVGLTFSADGRMFVWERGGRVWTVDGNVKSATPFLNISEEVAVWNNYGLLGFCLHPDFLNNGYVYALYAVDRHHLRYFGTPNYRSGSSETHVATIGRITRYTARAADGFRTIDPASRLVLLGESITNGFPLVAGQHGVGMILFGSDGTLLASCGDTASASITDIGNGSGTYYQQALNEGIIQPKENVGAYRAQLVDSLAGKVVRIDAVTGDGIPGNPFFEAAHPRAARSRVWALGLKTPSRMTLRPGTGSHHRGDANPGVLYIGDVGWNAWEDLNVCDRPGMNFGWPAFEGMDANSPYFNAKVANLDAPNPLYGVGGCTQRYFYFTDLIKQDTLDTPSWPNPCQTAQQIPSHIPRFLHARPAMDWKHGSGPARTPTFSGRNAAAVTVGAVGSPVRGASFGGNCVIGGIWYTAGDFPSMYRNTYFVADYGEQWIKNMVFDGNNLPVEVRNFASDSDGIVFLATHPVNGALYYVTWTSTVRKIRYVTDGNLPPTAVAAANKHFGPGPLLVSFTGTNSIDPEKLALRYEWNFGDGTAINTNANPVHEFNAPAGVPTRYDVTLRVTDKGGEVSDAALIVSVNNTPPAVVITSPLEGSFYSIGGDTLFDCTAVASDAEHDVSQLSCAWQTTLHHNNHIHSEPWDTNCATTTVLSPEGCDGQTYFYRVTLVVTDPGGLATTNEVLIYPDCPNVTPQVAWANPADILYGTALSTAQLNARANRPGTFTYTPAPGTILPPGNRQILTVTFTPSDPNYPAIQSSVLISVVTPPSAPENLFANASAGQIVLSWTDTAAHEAGFKLERSPDGVTFAPLAEPGANSSSFTNTGLPPDTTFYYRVAAFNVAGISEFSNTNAATTPATPAVALKINFQPGSEPVPPGYLADAGVIYGNRSNGWSYGWNKKNIHYMKVRHSSRSLDDRYDTVAYTYESKGGSVWEVGVPNGRYRVVLVAGDASKSSATYKFNVEKVLVVNGKASSSKRWIAGTNTVTVSDGRLSISNASGHKNNTLCFLEVSVAP
ncbi:MAG TPA: PQQ-dependent sugar dehydrogenase [Methylomirabilota bacterium]|nr:PQQ-dependent sugar dehydrogenase [Methylomirabilota bacterium]